LNPAVRIARVSARNEEPDGRIHLLCHPVQGTLPALSPLLLLALKLLPWKDLALQVDAASDFSLLRLGRVANEARHVFL